MRIENLRLHPRWMDTLATWHFDQWGALTGAPTREDYLELLVRSAPGSGIPAVLVALSVEGLCGSVSLLACDMTIRSALTPWLAQLFVAPSKRRPGTGAALVRAAAAHAKRCGFGRLYLYTSGTLPEFYRRLGWMSQETVEYLGRERTVMQLDLA